MNVMSQKLLSPRKSMENKIVPSQELDDLELKKSDLRAIVPNGTTDSELKIFYLNCKSSGLNPFMKEILLIKSNSGSTTVTTRDGYLKIANSNPHFDGLEGDCIYEGDILARRSDGSIHITYGENHFKFDRNKLIGAFANVYRKDRSKASSVFVNMKDYNKSTKVWEQYPNSMILKVAEAMALKRAFAISGLVTQEEVE